LQIPLLILRYDMVLYFRRQQGRRVGTFKRAALAEKRHGELLFKRGLH